MNGYETQRATPMKPIPPNATASPASSGHRRAPRHTTHATSGNSRAPTTRTASGTASPITNDMHQYPNLTGTSNSRDPVSV